MKLTKEMYIKAGIILAVIGTTQSATERVINQTTEIVTLRYETPNSNVSATNISVLVDETNLTDSPTRLRDYDYSSEEVDDEIVTKTDSDGSTTQKYENSKILFSYVVPVTSEKAPHVQKKEEEVEENDSEDIVVEEEEEEEEKGNLEEEEEKTGNSERNEDEYDEERGPYRRSEEEEEEEERPYHQREEEQEDEEERPYHRREDVIGYYHDDDSDEDHYETEEDDHGRTDDVSSTEKGSTHAPMNPWRHSYPHLIREKKPFLEFTTVQPYTDPRPVSYSSVVYDPDGRSKIELSGSFYKKPLEVVPESGVFPTAEEHISENTRTVPVTSQPLIEERSIKAPDEQIEDEEEDYVEPEVVTTTKTKQAVTTVAPIKTPEPVSRHNNDWEEEDYVEPEEVKFSDDYKIKDITTVTPKRTPKSVQPTLRPYVDWDEEEGYREPKTVKLRDHKIQYSTTVTPKRTLKSIQPTAKQHFDYEEEEDYIEAMAVTSKIKQDVTTAAPKRISKPFQPKSINWEEDEGDYIESDAVTTKANQEVTAATPKRIQKVYRPIPTRYWEEEEDYAEPEAETSNIIHDATTVIPKAVPRQNFDWEVEEPITKTYDERDEYLSEVPEDPKRYNEKTSQQFRDKTNRENYYEQTINTRFSSKEKGTSEEDKNYESEVGDLMKPKIEELRHETVQNNVVSEDDEAESEDMSEREIPTRKDRNQLYEYIIADGQLRQRVSENKESLLRHVLTTPKEEVVQTEPPPPSTTTTTTEPPKPKTTVTAKPQRYSFGTVTNPQSDQFMTFRNGETDDVTYNRIVSDIQSLFTPTTRRPPPPSYEQHFLPSQGNCKHQLPDGHHDSINYESFIKPSQTRPSSSEEEEEEEEEGEESPMPRRLPMKTYMVQKRPRPIPKKEIHFRPAKKPSAVKVTVHPMPYREAKPVMYRNAVYLGPAASPNQLVRKIVYYTPKERANMYHYSPTNQVVRIIPPASRMLIIRKIEQ